MKAMVLDKVGQEPQLTLKDLPMPPLNDYEALVKVKACGFCHHDLLVMAGILRRGTSLPLVLGHEVAGQVAQVGPGVTAVCPGDRVVCLPTDACGQCQRCLQGREHRCLDGRGLGHGVDGGMAQYLKVREVSLVKVPPQVPWVQACLLACPIGVGLRAVKEVARVEAGETVAVTGAGGGLGVHLIQMAKLWGARVLAVTSSEGKADPLRKLGADEVIVTGELDFSEVALALTEDRGVEVVLDTVGSPLFPGTLRCLASNGRMVVLGEVLGREVGLNLAELVFRDARIMGSAGASKSHVEEAVGLVSRGQVRPVISHVLPWEKVMQAYVLLQKRESLGRVVLQFEDSP